MSEMVERVARAICSAHGFDFDKDALPGGKDAFLDYARAAIEAMREPTEPIKKAGDGISTDVWGDSYFEENWRALIDAALK